MQSFVRSILCVAAVVGIAISAQAQIYFTDVFLPTFEDGAIRTVNTNGSGLNQVVGTGGGVRGLDVDMSAGKIYWADVDESVIRRANLDGTEQEDRTATGTSPRAVQASVGLTSPA